MYSYEICYWRFVPEARFVGQRDIVLFRFWPEGHTNPQDFFPGALLG